MGWRRPKQVLLTMQVLKFGMKSLIVLSVIYGLWVVYYISLLLKNLLLYPMI